MNSPSGTSPAESAQTRLQVSRPVFASVLCELWHLVPSCPAAARAGCRGHRSHKSCGTPTQRLTMISSSGGSFPLDSTHMSSVTLMRGCRQVCVNATTAPDSGAQEIAAIALKIWKKALLSGCVVGTTQYAYDTSYSLSPDASVPLLNFLDWLEGIGYPGAVYVTGSEASLSQ